jgi:hypothetical protein
MSEGRAFPRLSLFARKRGLSNHHSRLQPTRYLPVLREQYLVRERRRARQGFGEGPAVVVSSIGY